MQTVDNLVFKYGRAMATPWWLVWLPSFKSHEKIVVPRSASAR